MQNYIAALMLLTVPVCAHAQISSAAPPDGGGVRWSASLGMETMALRDIARTSRPVTASPVAWEGSGPVFRGSALWQNQRRFHRVDVGASLSGGFEYAGPVRRSDTFDDDRARAFDVRYEYRRYLLRDVWMRGLDIGAGVEALAARTSFARRIPSDVEMDEARTNAGVGGSVAARLRRWDRAGLEVAWTNGLIIGRRSETWTNGTSASGGGGGWLSTLDVRGDLRVASSARLFAAYRGSGEGFLATHRSYAVSRRSLSMGVTYAR